MKQNKRTRMYEPWGYREENNYQGAGIILENDLDSFFASVEYKRDDNKIHFENKDGEEVGTLNVDDFVKSDQIVEKAWYEDGKIYIKFTNGDVITIDVKEVIDENEFTDGLQVIDGVVSVLKDPASEKWLTVSENGVKVDGIQAEIDRLDGRIDDEIARATSEEERIEAKLDAEITRSTDEDARLDGKIDDETTRAKEAEAGLSRRIDTLNDELDGEKTIREAKDLEEKTRATSEEARIEAKIDSETARATSAETTLNDTKANKNEAIASASYDESAKTIYFYDISDNVLSSIDATPFITDGMIDDVKIENGKLIIVFNTDAGKETIEIPLSDIFNPDNYYTKDEIDEKVSTINDNISDEVSARESGDTALDEKIDALEAVVNTKANTTDVNAALDLKADKTEIPTDFYTKGEVDGKDNALQAAIDANTEAINAESARAISAETDIEIALSGKADADVVYTQEEVDALLAEKEAEMQVKYDKLKDMVLDLYYVNTYSIPTDCTLDTMLKSNNGDAKLTEDITTGTIAAGVTAKNIVKLSLGGKTVTFTGNTTTNPAMMFRNKQQVNIGGSGTIDAGGRVAVYTYGADCEITLSGTMFGRPTYITDRSGGELIYCELGTINITDGIFKNTGDDKRYLLNCKDANYKAGTAKIIVTGGKFYDFNPADNTAEGEHTSFVPEGYHVETSTDGESTVYTVKKDA
jgi:hypothetical protein